MSRPNVFELKAKYKRCLPLSTTPSPKRIRAENSSSDSTPSTPTIQSFANGTQVFFHPQLSERNIGALTHFAKTYCASRLLSEAATLDAVEFARRTPAKQSIAQFAITADILETLKGIRDEKALNWNLSKETNDNIKAYTRVIFLNSKVKSLADKSVANLLFTMCERKRFDIPEFAFKTPSCRVKIRSVISYHFAQTRSTFIKALKASVKEESPKHIYDLTLQLIGSSGVQFRARVCALVAIYRAHIEKMLSESSPKDDDTKLFSMVDKWLKNARIEYNGNHQGFAEELRSFLMADRESYGDDPSVAKMTETTDSPSKIEEEITDLIISCTDSGLPIVRQARETETEGLANIASGSTSPEAIQAMAKAFYDVEGEGDRPESGLEGEHGGDGDGEAGEREDGMNGNITAVV